MTSREMVDALAAGESRRPLPFTVLHDERCPLCRQLRAWLATQATLAPIEFVAAGSAEARARCPQLDHRRTQYVLTVVGADGAVYEGERAWLVCAWTLPRWQAAAEHASRRWRLPFVRLATRGVDAYRHRLLHRTYGGACGTAGCRLTAPAPWSPPDPRHRRG